MPVYICKIYTNYSEHEYCIFICAVVQARLESQLLVKTKMAAMAVLLIYGRRLRVIINVSVSWGIKSVLAQPK